MFYNPTPPASRSKKPCRAGQAASYFSSKLENKLNKNPFFLQNPANELMKSILRKTIMRQRTKRVA